MLFYGYPGPNGVLSAALGLKARHLAGFGPGRLVTAEAMTGWWHVQRGLPAGGGADGLVPADFCMLLPEGTPVDADAPVWRKSESEGGSPRASDEAEPSAARERGIFCDTHSPSAQPWQ